MPGKAERRAFTLIELLVVLAVISILAAILLPVFAQTREAARRISCISNLRQVSLGILMYVQDYDETFPCDSINGVALDPRFLAHTDAATTPYFSVYTWIEQVWPYMQNLQVFVCPSDPSQKVSSQATSPFNKIARPFPYL
ncbi:MAG TPA: type II secretion system protein [Chthonomonadaceae bacterium]|nr:type II secretion system protein [Chthonomonadaceae bacterium]